MFEHLNIHIYYYKILIVKHIMLYCVCGATCFVPCMTIIRPICESS